MKRLAFILSIIILIILAAYYFVFRDNTTLNPFVSDFALDNPAGITKIRISDQRGTSSLLRTTEGWKIEDMVVFQQKVEDLLLLANLIETRAPAPIEHIDTITTCLDEGKEVTFYHGKKVIKSFKLCNYNHALFARKTNSRKAFRISVRGYSNTDLAAIITSRKQDWQQDIIVDMKPGEIQLVSIRYPGTHKNGFDLMLDDTGNPFLFDDKGKPVEQHINYQRVEEYLYSFNCIKFFDAEKNSPANIFIINKDPFFELKLVNSKSDSISIAGYRLIDKNTGKLNPAGFLAEHTDYGLIFLKYSDLDPILVELHYFLKN